MVNYKKKYQKIVDELVKKSFPALKHKHIILTIMNKQIKNAHASVSYFGFFIWIFMFPLSRKFSLDLIRPILVHELSHCEIIYNMSLLEKLRFAFRWLFTKRGKAWFETEADKNVIKKGYAKVHYKLVTHVEKIRTKAYLELRAQRGYLSSKQIKQYAIKIGKW